MIRSIRSVRISEADRTESKRLAGMVQKFLEFEEEDAEAIKNAELELPIVNAKLQEAKLLGRTQEAAELSAKLSSLSLFRFNRDNERQRKVTYFESLLSRLTGAYRQAFCEGLSDILRQLKNEIQFSYEKSGHIIRSLKDVQLFTVRSNAGAIKEFSEKCVETINRMRSDCRSDLDELEKQYSIVADVPEFPMVETKDVGGDQLRDLLEWKAENEKSVDAPSYVEVLSHEEVDALNSWNLIKQKADTIKSKLNKLWE